MIIPGIVATLGGDAPPVQSGDWTTDELYTGQSFGSDSLNNTWPGNTFYESACMQIIFPVAKLTGAGMPSGAIIKAVSIWPTEVPGRDCDSFTFDFKNTADATVSSIQALTGVTTGLRLTGGVAITGWTIGDWNRYAMTDNDFVWNGTDNMFMSIYRDIADGYSSGGLTRILTGGGTSGQFWGYRKDNELYPDVDTSYDYNHGTNLLQVKVEWEK